LVCENLLRVTGVTPFVTRVTDDVIFGDHSVTKRHGYRHAPRRACMARPLRLPGTDRMDSTPDPVLAHLAAVQDT
jgi:hypothetical protein